MPHHPFDNDEDIIRFLQSGDRRQENEAVRYLWEKHLGLVKKWKYIYGGETSDVAMVLHESTVALVLNIREGKYDPAKSALSTYFCAIAKNILLKILYERDSGKVIPLTELPPDFPKLAGNNIERALDTIEITQKMMAAFEQLNETCRQVLTQFDLEDKSMREIAEVLGKSEIAVRQQHHRCREKLRKLLDSDFKNWFNEK